MLRPGGALVLSRQHPAGDWLRHGGNYFDVRVITGTWSKGWNVRYGPLRYRSPARRSPPPGSGSSD